MNIHKFHIIILGKNTQKKQTKKHKHHMGIALTKSYYNVWLNTLYICLHVVQIYLT